MGDFRDPEKVLSGQIEDVQVEIDRKERELFGYDDEMKALERRKELLESEIEDLLKEQQKLEQELRQVRNE